MIAASSAPTRVWIFLLAHRPNAAEPPGLVHHTYHRSQDYQEDQDTYVIAVRKNLDDSSLKICVTVPSNLNPE